MKKERMEAGDSKKNMAGDKPGRPGFSGAWIYIILIAVAFLLYYASGSYSSTREISWNQFKDQMLADRDVARIEVINKEIAEVYLKPESLNKPKYKDVAKGFLGGVNPGPHYAFSIGSVDLFEKRLDQAQAGVPESEKVNVQYTTRGDGWGSLLLWMIPLVLTGLLFFFFMRRIASAAGKAGGSFFDFGKSHPQVYEKGKYSPITFKDVAGYAEAKTEIMEIVEFLREPGRFTRLGAKIPKGVLLVGAPGTGKTLMAKAVAGEAGVPFFSLSGSEFVEMFVGVGASRVRDLFRTAKQKAPSIIFIDEIDTIGRMRGKAMSMQANDERESTLNQLLAEMDGFDANTGVIVMAATNRADILDPALLRPGRFDRHVHLDLPDKSERQEIFKVHIKNLKLDTQVNVEELAAQTPGFSGADISNVCNEAALIAARGRKQAIETQDFYNAIDRVIAGMEKKNKIISPEEKKVIAYHEAGHAVVGWMLEHMDPLMKVSIIPRGKSLGGAWYLPAERQIVTRQQYFQRLCAMLGGRVSEEMVFHEISSGALDDLERVTKQAYTMVAYLGLSDKLGSISFYDSTGNAENAFQRPYSEATAQLIDQEVQRLIGEAHDKTREILEQNRDKVNTLAQLLLKKEVVYKDELEKVLGKRKEKEEKVLEEV